jgi:hypothetical protein
MSNNFSISGGNMDRELLGTVDANMHRLRELVQQYRDTIAEMDTISLTISTQRDCRENLELMDKYLALMDKWGELHKSIGTLRDATFKHLYDIEDPNLQIDKGFELFQVGIGVFEGRPPGAAN